MPNRNALISFVVAVVLVALSVGVRLCSWEGLAPPNFSAVAACALFGGFYFRRSLVGAVAVPVVAMLVSDAIIGGYEWRQTVVVYAALALPALLGCRIGAVASASARAALVPLSALASSLLFFIATNGAVWAWSGMYEPTATGLLDCFISALPFFRSTVLGDLVFSILLFSIHAVAAFGLPIRGRRLIADPA